MKRTAFSILPIAAALATLATLGGCLSDDDDGAKTGTLKLGIVDAPVSDAKNVFVQFSGVELHGPDGSVTQTFATPKKIDLLAFTGSNATPLLEGTVTAGSYQWLRLLVDTDGVEDTYLITADDSKHELSIPAGAQNGLKLVRGFAVAAGGTSNFTIDFDLRKSLVRDGNGYKLKPTLRLVDNLETGTLAGSVAAPGCTAGVSAAVYVYNGSGATPDDIDGDGGDPVATATVNLTTGAYEAGFLPAGSYTVAYTCGAAGDDPELSDSLTFAGTRNATVNAGTTTTLNF